MTRDELTRKIIGATEQTMLTEVPYRGSLPPGPPTKPDPKGDRVEIVMSGKFLPYKRY